MLAITKRNYAKDFKLICGDKVMSLHKSVLERSQCFGEKPLGKSLRIECFNAAQLWAVQLYVCYLYERRFGGELSLNNNKLCSGKYKREMSDGDISAIVSEALIHIQDSDFNIGLLNELTDLQRGKLVLAYGHNLPKINILDPVGEGMLYMAKNAENPLTVAKSYKDKRYALAFVLYWYLEHPSAKRCKELQVYLEDTPHHFETDYNIASYLAVAQMQPLIVAILKKGSNANANDFRFPHLEAAKAKLVS